MSHTFATGSKLCLGCDRSAKAIAREVPCPDDGEAYCFAGCGCAGLQPASSCAFAPSCPRCDDLCAGQREVVPEPAPKWYPPNWAWPPTTVTTLCTCHMKGRAMPESVYCLLHDVQVTM